MTRLSRIAAATNNAPRRGIPEPAMGRGAVAGEPFGPVDYPRPCRFARTIRNVPPNVLAEQRRADDALNALRDRANAPDRLAQAIALFAVCLAIFTVAYFAAQFLR